jgi:type II secretory ATPase GspE/PulE/Tfp pilus assembly ATPase PilB-like protein
MLTGKALVVYDQVMQEQAFEHLARRGAAGVPVLVDALLARARARGASDLHLEPTPGALVARLRVDGVLENLTALPAELAPNLVARCKVISGLLTYRNDVPQEGGFKDESGEGRVSTFPTIHGEKVVVRFFQAGVAISLNQLGFSDRVQAGLTKALARREGMVLVTGPAGSGKTTTLYACLERLAREGRQVSTLEDPVERELPGVTQSSIQPAAGFDFARGLRSLLRQDPEVLLIGEIRDRGTAEISLEASLTGHLVLATLHAGHASGVAGRLLDMGLEPYLLTGALRGVLHQRLIRKRCECGGVCDLCKPNGWSGRRPLAEWLEPGPAFRAAILSRADAGTLEEAARADGLIPLVEEARSAVREGWTTTEEVRRVLGPEFAE